MGTEVSERDGGGRRRMEGIGEGRRRHERDVRGMRGTEEV